MATHIELMFETLPASTVARRRVDSSKMRAKWCFVASLKNARVRRAYLTS
jgi:hypothetical protein